MWSYDLAREQSASLETLRELCRRTLNAGYNALGLYFEHRFAFECAPWAAGRGALDAATVRALQREFPALTLIPMMNLLGHVEGFLRVQEGSRFSEERFKGLQACPRHEDWRALSLAMVREVAEAFDSEWIHLGGDETQQLGRCPRCEGAPPASLYGEFYAPLLEAASQAGKRPALWGDMLLAHPEAMEAVPRETLIFHWKYWGDPALEALRLREAGFPLALCPTLHAYDAPWMHLRLSEENVRAHEALEPEHFCLTTWEAGLFGSYETMLPAIEAVGRGETDLLGAYHTQGEAYGEWAELMGVALPALGGCFGGENWRHPLRVRLLLMGNPFLAWLHHGEELAGPLGQEAHALVSRALAFAPDAATRGVAQCVQGAIEFVRYAEEAKKAYAAGLPGVAAASLCPAREVFQNLEKVAQGNALRFGGSLADVGRCRLARERVEQAILRVKQYGDGSLGYLPAFEHLTHPAFVPHDQGAWWKVNAWALE